MTVQEMEVALAMEWNYRQYWIVPNVGFGLNLHECDLLLMSDKGYLTEIEIKISKADLKKDQSKSHGHVSKRIKFLYFAVPERMQGDDCIALVPERAGIVVVRDRSKENRTPDCLILRPARENVEAGPCEERTRIALGRLAQMRIWTLKGSLNYSINENNRLRQELKKMKADIAMIRTAEDVEQFLSRHG